MDTFKRLAMGSAYKKEEIVVVEPIVEVKKQENDPFMSTRKVDGLGRTQKLASPIDPNQSDPTTTDTTQMDPSVDSVRTPMPYLSGLRTRGMDKLKNPTEYNAAGKVEISAAQLLANLNNTNQ